MPNNMQLSTFQWCYYAVILSAVAIFLATYNQCYVLGNGEVGPNNTFIISSVSYPEETLGNSRWIYLRVEIPLTFSSVHIELESDVHPDSNDLLKVPEDKLPVICIRDGSLPLPDVSYSSMEDPGSLYNISFGVSLADTEHCYPLQKNISLKLTNEQISPGVWYFGIFNGIGATRTQRKMIDQGPSYSFSFDISIEGCATTTVWGPYCNETVEPLPCLLPYSYNLTRSANETAKNVISCTSSDKTFCHKDGKLRVYSLEVLRVAEQLSLTAKHIQFNGRPSNNTQNTSRVTLMCFARHNAMPSLNFHEYNASLDENPLVIRSPKVGRWYFVILPVDQSRNVVEIQNTDRKPCYSLESEVLECPVGKTGPDCTWKTYMLKRYPWWNGYTDSYYLPNSYKVPTDEEDFVLEPLLSNSSNGRQEDSAWTYFLMDIPAAGAHIHIQLTSDAEMIPYEIYARFGGLPSLDAWDYYYANKSSNSDADGSVFFKLYNSSAGIVDFYILYVKEGTWSFGIRHLSFTSRSLKDQTTISFSDESCPNECFSNGDCKIDVEASGQTAYGYCNCDRNHGGVDCGIEIVSPDSEAPQAKNDLDRTRQTIFLVASNAAAILPAFWALRKKNVAEWVIFTCSGISSAFYHACDVGTYCALSFHVLQFMDFWLSFIAVVSTFMYLTTISEASKRAIQMAVAILTALMAITSATRSSNRLIVMVIGGIFLLVGWLMEFSTKWRQYSSPFGCCSSTHDRWDIINAWLKNLYKTVRRRYNLGFILGGFIFLGLAATSWLKQTSKTYWIWHSMWHITIYTSSFLFLCSKADIKDSDDSGSIERNYELTRQNSITRAELSHTLA